MILQISQGSSAMLDRTQEGENVQLPNTLKIVNYSSRFVTRTARTQGIGQRGKTRASLAQPKADCRQTWPSLALSWSDQEPT